MINFYTKIWQFKTPALNKKFAVINKKAFALGQKICLCEANAFRKWLVETKPLKADQMEIDLIGKHDNGHIIEAYNLYDSEYESYKSKRN